MKNSRLFHASFLRYQQLPVLRILIPFGGGILWSYGRGACLDVGLWLGIAVGLWWLAWRSRGWVAVLFYGLLFGVLGGAWYGVRERPKGGFVEEGKGKVAVWLDRKVGVSAYFETYRSRVIRWKPAGEGRMRQGEEKVLVKFRKGEDPGRGLYVMEGQVRRLFKGNVPFYINWNRRRWASIVHVFYPYRWVRVRSSREGFVVRWRRFLAGGLHRALSGDEWVLGRSILLGIREGMGERLKAAFSRAGAMHVLAISGLHVGIIYLPLALLTRRWRYGKAARWLRLGLIGGVLAGYAMLTGLHSSVVRAAVMFFLFGVADSMEKDQWALNTALVSLFLMLVARPSFLLDVGFQLSYAAVIGIIVFMGVWRRWVAFSNRWVQRMAVLLMVSAAAVVATSPLVVYYFGRLPMYGVITSLAVIPLVTLVVYVGAAYLMLYSVFGYGIAAMMVGKVLALLLSWMKWVSSTVSAWPGVLWKGLYFSEVELMVVMLGVVVLALLFYGWDRWEVWAAMLVVLAGYGTVRTVRKFRVMRHPRGAWTTVASGVALMVPQGPVARVFLFRAGAQPFLERHRRMLDGLFIKEVRFDSLPAGRSYPGVVFRGPLVVAGGALFQLHRRGDPRPWVAARVIGVSSRRYYRKISFSPMGSLWKSESMMRRKVVFFPLSTP